MPQADRILKYMKEHPDKGISQREAIYLGCYRLSARIHDMRAEGHHIVTDLIKVKSTDGATAMVGYYRLIKEKEDVSTGSDK